MDLRNHGRSAEIEGLNPPHDLVNVANDLAHLIQTRGWAWPDVVLGHSFGGKVALQFAQSCLLGHYGDSAKLPKQVFTLPLKVLSFLFGAEVALSLIKN